MVDGTWTQARTGSTQLWIRRDELTHSLHFPMMHCVYVWYENKKEWDLAKQSPRSKSVTYRNCLVPRRLSFDENVRAKEGGKETTGETSFADLVFKIAARVMADQYAIFKISSALFICEFWANHCLSTSCVWRGSCFYPTHWTQAS